jgi:MFS transporter, NNP family, nitrate/nitrite transporter
MKHRLIFSVTVLSCQQSSILWSTLGCLTPHRAWRVAYVVPFIIIVAVALGMLLTCDDLPTGKWSERALHLDEGNLDSEKPNITVERQTQSEGTRMFKSNPKDAKYSDATKTVQSSDLEVQFGGQTNLEGIKGEFIVTSTSKEILYIISSPATLALVGQYACSFGAELAFDSILGPYYAANFAHLGQTRGGQWAAMFGLLNVLFRPLGGFISDQVYHRTNSVWAKKIWLTVLGVATGTLLLVIGISNLKSEATMFGLFAGLAFFLEAANGANFSVIPHVHPAANGGSLRTPLPGTTC